MRTLSVVLYLVLYTAALPVAQTPTPPGLVEAPLPLPSFQGRQTAPPTPTTPPATAASGRQTRPPTAVPSTQVPVPATPPPAAPSGRVDFLATPAMAVNIRLELTITDTLTGSATSKTLAMHIMSGESGSIRVSGPGGSSGQLDVDASVRVYQNTMIRTSLSFSYGAVAPVSATPVARPAGLQESITVLLQDGKPLLVSQSADPGSDRKVMVEVKATIVR